MTLLFQAHSGLRYLVLLAGIVACAWFLLGWIRRRPWGPPAPAALGAFIGLLDLQALLGIAMWLGGHTAPGLVEHLGLMLGAVVVAHLTAILNRRRPAPAGFGLPLAGVTLALVLIAIGIHALGRALV
jgi:hypothetical protein